MVDLDELDNAKSGGGSSTGGKKQSSSSPGGGGGSGQSSSSSSSGGSGETFSMDKDEMVDPSDKNVSDISKQWASDKGELNTDVNSGEGLKAYMNRQVKEVEELHENINEMAMNNKDNFDEFTLFMHALFLNFGRNRVGIMDTIQDDFGKSKRESFELTNKICQRAGEPEFMEQMVQDITEDLSEL